MLVFLLQTSPLGRKGGGTSVPSDDRLSAIGRTLVPAGGGNSLQQTWRFKAVQHETHGAVGCLLLSWSLTRSPVPQHKKLAEGSAYEELPTSVMYSENDISNSIKNGILYLEDPINHVGAAATTLSHVLTPALRKPPHRVNLAGGSGS